MGIGRLLCVALPFILTVSSIICLLIVGLAGVSNKDLYMFRVNMTDLEFNPTKLDQLQDVVSDISDIIPRTPAVGATWHDPQLLQAKDNSDNVTSVDLSLAALYDVSLWGWCETDFDGGRNCTSAKYDWASDILNDTITKFQNAAAMAGQDVILPDAVETAMKAFATVTKWSEVVYVAALVALAVELFFGIFATCSRAWSCVTAMFALTASILVCSAAGLSTAMSVVLVGAVEGTAQWYGVRSHFNTTFLAFSWLAAAFALGAGFFWMFTVCCCASSDSGSKRGLMARSVGNNEKTPVTTGTYQPLGEQHEMTRPPFYAAAQQYGNNRQSVGPRSDQAYEPYSHNQV